MSVSFWNEPGKVAGPGGREPTRAVHYLSGDYILRSWHNASTHAARLGSSVTNVQATSFFIPKRDTHAPLVVLFCPLCLSERSGDPVCGTGAQHRSRLRGTPPMFKAQGACHELCKICDADFLKEIPTALQSANNLFQKAKLLR